MKSKSPSDLLVGTWKLRDMANAGDSMIGTATFSRTDTLLLKTIINGKITDTTNCSYELPEIINFLPLRSIQQLLDLK